MWKGVTEFLENVDQKAAEFAQRRDDHAPSHVAVLDNSEEDDWAVGGSRRASDASVAEAPADANVSALLTSSAPMLKDSLPSPQSQSDGSLDVLVLQQQIATLNRRLSDVQKGAASDNASRGRALQSLQAEYDAVVAKNRSLAIEVDHWQVLSTRAADAQSALEIKLQAAESELADIRTQKQGETSELEHWEHQCAEQQAQMEEQRRELAAATAQARRATESANTARSELSDYRIRSKILLDEKDKQILDLQQNTNGNCTRAEGQHEGRAPDAHSLSHATEMRQAEARIRSLSEQLQQKTDALDAIEGTLRDQQLVNAQLKELLEGEHTAKASVSRALEERLAERQSAIDALEKRLAQLQQTPGNTSTLGVCESPSNAESERRAKELAQLLMEKQSALETKRAEADQWRTRFEVSQQRLREAELVSSAVQRGVDGVSRRAARYTDVASAEAQQTIENESVSKHRVMSLLASKGGWGIGVVNAAVQIDRISLRAGGILRRNSLLRVFMVCYVAILQLYIFIIVSFSSSIPSGNAHEGVPPSGR